MDGRVIEDYEYLIRECELETTQIRLLRSYHVPEPAMSWVVLPLRFERNKFGTNAETSGR